MLLFGTATSAAFSQENQRGKVFMSITRNGVTESVRISAVSYSFSKYDRDSGGIENMVAEVIITCGHFNRFLLEAASGGTSNRILAVIRCCDKNGKEIKTIEMKDAVVTQCAESFGDDYDGNQNTLDIVTSSLVVDGVKM